MKWNAKFIGREVGALGKFSPFAIEVEGDTKTAAELAIYATHEHLRELELTPENPPESAEYPWECFGCGFFLPALDKGFNTKCPLCGSYEIHLKERA